MRILRKWLVLLAFGVAPLPALGQFCVNFVDVPASDEFCEEIEWIKNRGVTLGCTATEYCPNNNVLRSQMAAFMNRLGNVLQPTILRVQDNAFDGTYNPSDAGCVSNPFEVTGYPRQASFAATLMNFNANATKTIQGRLVFSTAGSTGPWQSTGDFVMWQTVEPAERSTLPLIGGPLNLDVGQTYHFAIETQTNDPAATVSGECQLNVRIESRTGATSPF